MRTPRWFKGILGLVLLLGVTWPKEAWLSGAMDKSGMSRSYTLTIAEMRYRIGVSRAPSAEAVEAEQRSWSARLAEVMTVADKWLAQQVKDQRLAPVDITLATALVGLPRPTQAGGVLARPTLIELPRCLIEQRNLSVTLRIALKSLPTPEERTALSESLCAAVRAAGSAPDVAQPLLPVAPVRADRGALELSLTGDFSVPASWLPAVDKQRADFFKQATEVMQRSCQRFEKQYPGATVQRVRGLGINAVRFFMEAPFGGFDLLTAVVVAPGARQPSVVALKDVLYEDWRAAGLPMQVELPTLLRSPSR